MVADVSVDVAEPDVFPSSARISILVVSKESVGVLLGPAVV